jgi:tRNA threonylcarbamoyladenosine biosynthesis protein TsaE
MRYMSTGMIWQTSSISSEYTERLGALLGSRLKGGEVIELRSDLGGGKTTFVKGLVKGAGSQERVASPTFTLNRIYKAKHFDIYHFDFYRLDEPGIMEAELAEALADKHVVVIEWADIVHDVLPPEHITIEFQPVTLSSDERQVRISYPANLRQLISYLEASWPEVMP